MRKMNKQNRRTLIFICFLLLRQPRSDSQAGLILCFFRCRSAALFLRCVRPDGWRIFDQIHPAAVGGTIQEDGAIVIGIEKRKNLRRTGECFIIRIQQKLQLFPLHSAKRVFSRASRKIENGEDGFLFAFSVIGVEAVAHQVSLFPFKAALLIIVFP